jgi:tetratricopeptide (TPR) repeat protein
MRALKFSLLLTLLSGSLFASTKNLIREDLYVRTGFDATWINQWPDRSKNSSDWRHIPATTSGNRTVRIADLGKPFPTPGIYHWSNVKPIHEYTAVTRFFISPKELKNPHAWGLRLGSIADNWIVYANGIQIATAWHPSKDNTKLLVHRAIRDTLIEIPYTALKPGENIIAYRMAGDRGSADVGFFMGQPYEVGPLRELMHARGETIVMILIALYLAVGLYHLLLYSRRPQESYNLFFGLFCVGLFVYLFTRTSLVFEVFDDTSFILKVELVVLFNIMTPFLIFIDKLFENRVSMFPKIYSGIAVVLSLAVIPTTPLFNTTILRAWQIIALLGILYFMVFQISKTLRREIRNRMQLSATGPALVRFFKAFGSTMLHSPVGNLFLGILTIMATATFDILDSAIFSTGIALSKYGFAIFVLGIAVMLANRFLSVYQQVEELNTNLEKKVVERTQELQESLVRVQDLKKQQDADYFLTAQLLKPLAANTSTSKNIHIEYLIKQKKTFEFKKWKSEIGGDINMAASITLKDQPYVVFVNADAMGKSMQGAGGALVLGAVFQSTIERLRWTKELSDVFPEIWLHTTFLELHRIFESFEGSMLISLVIGLIDEATGLMYYINAEHPSMVLYRKKEAAFLDSNMLRKLGTPGIKGTLQIHCQQLIPGDVIVMGSDGRDDLILGKNADGSNIVNENEMLFIDHVIAADGDLEEIFRRVKAVGEIMDDLSLLKIAYAPEAGSIQTPVQIEDNRKTRQHAVELMEAGDYAAAVTAFTQVYELDPQDLEACYLIAQCLRREKKIRVGIQWAERCVLREPENVQFLLLAAELNIMVRRAGKARGLIGRILALEPLHQRAAKLESMVPQ